MIYTIYKTPKVQNYSSLKDEAPLALQANVIYLLEFSCGKNQTDIGKTKRQLGLWNIFQEMSSFLNKSSCIACNHSTIKRFYILAHGNDFDK